MKCSPEMAITVKECHKGNIADEENKNASAHMVNNRSSNVQ